MDAVLICLLLVLILSPLCLSDKVEVTPTGCGEVQSTRKVMRMTIGQEIFPINVSEEEGAMHPGSLFEQLLWECNCGFVNRNVRGYMLSTCPILAGERIIRLIEVEPHGDVPLREILDEIAGMGYRGISPEELLKFGKTYPCGQQKYQILALGGELPKLVFPHYTGPVCLMLGMMSTVRAVLINTCQNVCIHRIYGQTRIAVVQI